MTTTKKRAIEYDTTPDPIIKKSILALRKSINAIGSVETPEQCLEASELLTKAAKLRRACTTTYTTRKAPILTATREIDTLRNNDLDAITSLEASLKRIINAFRETERKARELVEEQRRSAAEANAETQRQQKIAELLAAAEQAPTAEVRKVLEHQASVVEKAHAIIEPIETVDAPQLLAKGQHERTIKHAAIDDFRKLVLQVASTIMRDIPGGAPVEVRAFLEQFKPNAQATIACLQPAMPVLNDLAKTIPADDLALEGVRVVEDKDIISRWTRAVG